ncbi:hypothetical protein RRG08_064283 [Elysia crispata]|uniref:Uncharacterized protein n=1 Tax=Elysia crispata TaxID=231223 RepID=A0AAE0YTX8_9GAST|nr:hypothetical protein RRG08_064283 [Elysia crispata]
MNLIAKGRTCQVRTNQVQTELLLLVQKAVMSLHVTLGQKIKWKRIALIHRDVRWMDHKPKGDTLRLVGLTERMNIADQIRQS